MKRVLTVAFAVAVCAAFIAVAQTTVTSVNVVGYVRKTLLPSGKYHQLAPAFDGMTTNTITGVFGTNTLRAGPNPFQLDRVFIWDTSAQQYNQIGLFNTDYCYHSLTNPTGPAVDPEIGPGDGLWVISASAGPYASQTNQFAMLGEAVSASNVAQSVVVGYQMLGVPFSTAMYISNLNFQASGATPSAGSPMNADRIFVWDESNSYYRQYGLKTTGWRELYPVGRWDELTETGDQIQMGQGFWYVAKNAFTWTLANPYISNL